MPTYDYACKGCGHSFEHFQSMTDNKLRKCPDCGERKLERLIGTGAGVIFKGSGFYETDYKRKPVKTERGKDNPDSSETTSKKSEESSSSGDASSKDKKQDDAAPKVKTKKKSDSKAKPKSD